jgi:hydrogenase maturation protease
MSILVLGIGNVLLQDEGLGVRAVEQLQRRFELPREVDVLDGGTAGMALLDDFIDYQRVIIVDAVSTGQSPGTIVRLGGTAVPAFFQTAISPHQLGISELLATLELAGERPEHIVLLGMVPKSTELSLDLTDEISRRLDDLTDCVASELAAWGCPLTPVEPDSGIGSGWRVQV